MTDQQKNTQEKPRTPGEGMPFAGMMQEMMEQMGEGCGCSDKISQMMAMCFGTQDKNETENPAEETVKDNII